MCISIKLFLNIIMRSVLALRHFFATRRYTKSHEWIEYYPQKKVAKVGITNYAQQQLGEIIHIEFPAPGKTVQEKDSTAVIESVKIAADIYTPVTGKITGYNKQVEQNPSLVNDSAESSWIFEITYQNEAPGLLTPEQYKNIIG